MTMRRACAVACALLVGASASSLHAQATAPGTATPSAPSTPATPPAAEKRTARRVVTGVAQALERAAQARERRKATSAYDPIFRKYTKRYFGVATDWRWFKAQGIAESNLVPTARSHVGARGIMQLMPSTWKGIATKRPEFRAIDDPEWNIAAGIMHDRYLWELWTRNQVGEDERWNFMFASYNAGQGTIYRARALAAKERLDMSRWQHIERVAPKVGRWRYTETLGYVRKINANYEAFGVLR